MTQEQTPAAEPSTLLVYVIIEEMTQRHAMEIRAIPVLHETEHTLRVAQSIGGRVLLSKRDHRSWYALTREEAAVVAYRRFQAEEEAARKALGNAKGRLAAAVKLVQPFVDADPSCLQRYGAAGPLTIEEKKG